MKLPPEVPVMILPNATLFPQALLPIYIFEPRYRQMLSDALRSHRMFCVAMQKPTSVRESPSPVAGLGLIRVAVDHQDGTSHLVLQGLARVELQGAVRYKPYRIHRVNPLYSRRGNTRRVGALVTRVKLLLRERLKLGLPFPFPAMSPKQSKGKDSQELPGFSPSDVLDYLDQITDPEQAADMVSCAVLPGAQERQTILETIDLEGRLSRLIIYLIEGNRKKKS